MDNQCITQDGVAYTMDVDACTESSIDPHVFQTFNNTLYSANVTFSNGPCKTFKDWQAAGQDRDSTLQPMPSVDTIVAMGRRVLGM
jgi:hypothetical protein